MTLRFTVGLLLLLMTACVAPPVAQFSEHECAGWAVAGECDSNKAFMMQSCRKSCQKVALERKAYDKRCPAPSNHTPALLPGAMPHTFSRIMNDFADLEPEMLSHDPPVVLFNSFMSDAEADAFMRHGAGHYERSRALEMTDQGKMAEVETSYRTSSHAWCQAEDCVHDRDIQRVSQRVANVTQTPETNAEYIMLLYYHACRDRTDDDCAFYRQHTDYIGSDRHKLQGVRIYTLMAFLNDVPEGGATSFTNLPSNPVSVQARKGKAVLWPSVLSDDPNQVDLRTQHEALPVTRGEKFGAMFWIHQYDFKGSMAQGCTVD